MAKNDTANVPDFQKEILRVARTLEFQNSLKYKLLSGIVFGLGTAIGASIIASILLLASVRALRTLGVDTSIFATPSAIMGE